MIIDLELLLPAVSLLLLSSPTLLVKTSIYEIVPDLLPVRAELFLLLSACFQDELACNCNE